MIDHLDISSVYEDIDDFGYISLGVFQCINSSVLLESELKGKCKVGSESFELIMIKHARSDTFTLLINPTNVPDIVMIENKKFLEEIKSRVESIIFSKYATMNDIFINSDYKLSLTP